MKYRGKHEEYFELVEINDSNCHRLEESLPDKLRLIWFTSDNNKILVDGLPYVYNKNQILSLTQFHTVEYKKIESVRMLRFNREFYCILDHDSEVGCKGLLYYGAAELPVVNATGVELEILSSAWSMAALEMQMHDELQLEMLQMMLRRILILCTRIYKRNLVKNDLIHQKDDLLREFNYLVEQHFRDKHSVSEYAAMLFKSPKTMSNSFKRMGTKSPLKFIQERIALEARRLLIYTDKDISDISYELGFLDIQGFSRFFKKQEGVSPSDFRKGKVKKL